MHTHRVWWDNVQAHAFAFSLSAGSLAAKHRLLTSHAPGLPFSDAAASLFPAASMEWSSPKGLPLFPWTKDSSPPSPCEISLLSLHSVLAALQTGCLKKHFLSVLGPWNTDFLLFARTKLKGDNQEETATQRISSSLRAFLAPQKKIRPLHTAVNSMLSGEGHRVHLLMGFLPEGIYKESTFDGQGPSRVRTIWQRRRWKWRVTRAAQSDVLLRTCHGNSLDTAHFWQLHLNKERCLEKCSWRQLTQKLHNTAPSRKQGREERSGHTWCCASAIWKLAVRKITIFR